MFRSKELLTLLNKFGHCESYSFSLETAIAKSVQKSASLLPQSIICKPLGRSVLHSEFDNFDKIVNELYGAGSVHTAHGIMLEDIEYDEVGNVPCTPAPKQKRNHSKNFQMTTSLTLI